MERRALRCEKNDPMLDPHVPIATRAFAAATAGVVAGTWGGGEPARERGRSPPEEDVAVDAVDIRLSL